MKGHTWARGAWACIAVLSILLTGLGATTQAIAQTSYCLPTCSETDGRFISLAGSKFKSVAGDQITITLASITNDSLVFDIFDGETGGVWDAGTSPLVFTLFADPHGDGTGTTVVGHWSGASMRDTAWYRIAVGHDSSSLAESGAHFYMLKIRMQWGDTTDADYTEDDAEDDAAIATWSNFKIRSIASMSTTQFAFCAPLFSTREAGIVYPNYPLLTSPLYDGTWRLFVQVPRAMHTFEVWDGDMDFGSWDGLSMDTDDQNTSSTTVPSWSGTTAVEEGVATSTDYIRTILGALTSVLGTGSPLDDNMSAVYRRSPSVYYDVIDPNGYSYRNSNPSGNMEWERFSVGTRNSTTSVDANAEYLPRGVYEVRITGMDMHNLNAWRYGQGVLGVSPTGDVERMPLSDCPQTTTRAFGRGPSAKSSVEISKNGTLTTWGDNCQGQLGDGTKVDRSVPVRVLKGDYGGSTYLGDGCNGVAQVALHHTRMVALLNDGGVYSWGDNASSLLGVGPTAGDAVEPKHVLKGAYPGTSYLGDSWTNPIVSLAAGDGFSAALTNGGVLYTWGKNDRGQLGDNTTTNRTEPVRVLKGAYDGTTYLGDNPSNPIVDIVAADKTMYALAADGTVYAWGLNDKGQNGDNTTTTRHTPVKVLKGAYSGTTYLGDSSTEPITQICSMSDGCMALASSGKVYTWGLNGDGQIGDNTLTNRTTPVRVLMGAYGGTTYLGDADSNKIVSMAAGAYHCLALSALGEVYSWGDNSNGMLGDNTTTTRKIPVRVLKGLYSGTTYLGDDTVKITALGGAIHHSLALSNSNNTSYAWGLGSEGRLGEGATTNRLTPIIVSQGARPGKAVVNETETETIDVTPVAGNPAVSIEAITLDAEANAVRLSLHADADLEVSLDLASGSGQLIDRPIVHHEMHEGDHQLEIVLPDGLPSGIYFVTARTSGGAVTKKFVLAR